MDARNTTYWLQRIYHDLAGTTLERVNQVNPTYWLQMIYKELSGVDLVGDQRSFDYWSEAIYFYLAGITTSNPKGTLPAHYWWQRIYALRAGVTYPDGSNALSLDYWLQQAQQIGLESSAPVTPWYLITGITPRAAYQPKGAASLAASYSNLANPGTNNAAPGVAPTFASATGWRFNGIDQYLTTGLIATVSWTALIRYNVTTMASVFGAFNGGSGSGFLVQAAATDMRVWVGDQMADNGPLFNSGTYGMAGRTPYRNGSAEASIVPVSAVNPALAMFIGALNLNGAPAQYSALDVYAFIAFDSVLTAGQVAAQVTAMNAL